MIIAIILRAVQFIFAVVVLGLSVALVKDQDIGSSPATINYNAFCGGFGMLVAILGISAIWVEALGGLVMAAVDGLASIFFLAGALAVVITLRGISCTAKTDSNWNKMLDSALLNGGCVHVRGAGTLCGADFGQASQRCKKNEADAAFEFMSFALCAGCAVLSVLAMKRGSGTKGALV
ncbi:uncharacterized protein BDZ99DRAFT_472014 [Mytilinidion resinicola]|uniref:MARVEL domain-containing protein n=1 Tax=Mytilinidion resinicola TaxID=574789 RepID=A0A6A6Z370_9PEZI|nr:uncharacterized protein BDZ99DRAFT_472014 [Mytilinidion resinicola]KAF2814605.1 hypothetical protein BDZ99DRAFT_472014 [Mytilinidion resinicola]